MVSLSDKAVLYKSGCDKFMIVAVAIDNLTIMSESDKSTELLKQQVCKHWEITDLGSINWLLSVKITCDLKAQTISLCQQSYIEQILVHCELKESQPVVTPLEPGVDLTPDSPAVSPTLLTPAKKRTYQEMIRSLIYVTVIMRPDLAFAVSTLSQYLKAPHSTHMRAVTHVFCYLLGTKHLKLILGGTQNKISGYSDADWASHIH